MDKYWQIVEKTVSVLWVIFGVLGLSYLIIDISNWMQSMTTASVDLNFLLTRQYPILICLFLIFGGLLLFFKKKLGWLMVIASCFVLFLGIIIGSFHNTTDGWAFELEENKDVFSFVFISFLALILFLFTREYFLNKYLPSSKDFSYIALFVFFFVANRLLLQFEFYI